jgi:hypothetical protein
MPHIIYTEVDLEEIFSSKEFTDKLADELISVKSTSLLKFLNSLPTNKNYYKTGQRNKFQRGFRKKPTQSEETQTIKKVNVLLNKMSPLNVPKIIEGVLLELKFYPHLTNIVTESILEKAILQNTYCPHYVDLIIELIKVHDVKHILGTLLTQFKEKYITNEYMDSGTDAGTVASEDASTGPEKNAQEKYDDFCKKNKLKDYLMGYAILIVQLYNKKLVNLNYINMIINLLLNKLYYTDMADIDVNQEKLDLVENNVFCLHKIFTTVRNKKELKGFIQKIDILLEKKKYKPKLRFKMMDIKELY